MDEKRKIKNKIGRFREIRKKRKVSMKNLTVIKRNKKIFQALDLPKVLNLNPRSVYNKANELVTFIEEESVDLICISESWERENLTLNEIIQIENYSIISNVHQRRGKGGRPAIIVNSEKYQIENLTQTVIDIPWGVEVVWALLSPKNATNDSSIQKIVVASIYSKPDSRKKSVLLDHISQVYSLLSSKYENGLHWILSGDTNDLKLDPILHLNAKLQQCVKFPTRLNPPKMLDPIITTLSGYYQEPQCLPPLDPDPECNGKPSDHLMVLMSPISVINNKPVRSVRSVTNRPITKHGLSQMQEWICKENWSKVTCEKLSSNVKMEALQKLLLSKYQEFFPEKSRNISSDDSPYFNEKLKKMKRRKCREFSKHRRSNKWVRMNKEYSDELVRAKHSFYRNKIKKLRKGNPKAWHRELKKLTRFGQHQAEEIIVEEIKELSNKEQAEKIADKFAAVSQEYDELKNGDIEVPNFSDEDIPVIKEEDVAEVLAAMDTSKSNVAGDIPAKVFKSFSTSLAIPVTNVINTCIREGCWPDILKLEMVTPVPKVSPPKKLDELRNISGLLNLDKIYEKIISKMMISDMKVNIDPAQFANQQGLSIQHYLVKMIDRIHMALDNNSKSESCAVLATLIDWKQAFPRQCPKLGVQSFIKNGVRPSLIPILINYFQGRKMKVKWHGEMSEIRQLPGGGPQGSTFGIWEYLSQSNDNANCVSESERFKFVDDLSILEIINLLSVGIATYNVRSHVPSNIPAHNQIIVAENLKSQQYLSEINEWTIKNKMQLNEKKTKNMIFNFSKKNQFTTKLTVNKKDIEVVKETKLLGTVITEDLKWNKNTREIVIKAYKRMQLLNKAASFTSNIQDLRCIYLTYIRSVLEQSAVVWHSSLTYKNRKDLERVQKAALRVILKSRYSNYKSALEILRIETLEKRREVLCLRFAKNCLKNSKVKNFFPEKKQLHKMKKRKMKKFKVNKAFTKRYSKTSIPFMQKMLNEDNDLLASNMKCNGS